MPAKLDSMRDRYLELAGSKRLVIKNPYGLARVDMLKHMFPDALFVFSLRAPWPTIQSATRKGNSAFLLPTDFVNSLPDSLLLRAAATWAESIEVLWRERDANWMLVRHEDLDRPPAVGDPGSLRQSRPRRAADRLRHAPARSAARRITLRSNIS